MQFTFVAEMHAHSFGPGEPKTIFISPALYSIET